MISILRVPVGKTHDGSIVMVTIQNIDDISSLVDRYVFIITSAGKDYINNNSGENTST